MTTENSTLDNFLFDSLKWEREQREKSFRITGNMASIIGCQTSIIGMLKRELQDAVDGKLLKSEAKHLLDFAEKNQKMCEYVWENRDKVEYSDISTNWQEIAESLGK